MMVLKSCRDILKEIEKIPPDKAIDYFYKINYRISTLLVKYRTDKKLTQKQMAEKLGVSCNKIYKYESGNYNFTLKEIAKIYKEFGE